MSQVGYVTQMYNTQCRIVSSNAPGYIIENINDAIVNNGLIIASPIDEQFNDKGTPTMFISDSNGSALRLTYNFKFGDGLIRDEENSDLVRLSIDHHTITDNTETTQLYVNTKNLIDDNNSLVVTEENNLKVNTPDIIDNFSLTYGYRYNVIEGERGNSYSIDTTVSYSYQIGVNVKNIIDNKTLTYSTNVLSGADLVSANNTTIKINMDNIVDNETIISYEFYENYNESVYLRWEMVCSMEKTLEPYLRSSNASTDAWRDALTEYFINGNYGFDFRDNNSTDVNGFDFKAYSEKVGHQYGSNIFMPYLRYDENGNLIGADKSRYVPILHDVKFHDNFILNKILPINPGFETIYKYDEGNELTVLPNNSNSSTVLSGNLTPINGSFSSDSIILNEGYKSQLTYLDYNGQGDIIYQFNNDNLLIQNAAREAAHYIVELCKEYNINLSDLKEGTYKTIQSVEIEGDKKEVLKVNTENLSKASENNFGVVKVDNKTIKTTSSGSGIIEVNTPGLDYINSKRSAGIINVNEKNHLTDWIYGDANGFLKVKTKNMPRATKYDENNSLLTDGFGVVAIDGNTIVNADDIAQGVIKVNTENLTKASNTEYGVVKIDNDTIKFNTTDTINVVTENLNKASRNQYGVSKIDGQTISINDNGQLYVVGFINYKNAFNELRSQYDELNEKLNELNTKLSEINRIVIDSETGKIIFKDPDNTNKDVVEIDAKWESWPHLDYLILLPRFQTEASAKSFINEINRYQSSYPEYYLYKEIPLNYVNTLSKPPVLEFKVEEIGNTSATLQYYLWKKLNPKVVISYTDDQGKEKETAENEIFGLTNSGQFNLRLYINYVEYLYSNYEYISNQTIDPMNFTSRIRVSLINSGDKSIYCSVILNLTFQYFHTSNAGNDPKHDIEYLEYKSEVTKTGINANNLTVDFNGNYTPNFKGDYTTNF